MTTNSTQAKAAHSFAIAQYHGSVSKFIQLAKTEEAHALGMTKKAFGELAHSMYVLRQIRNKATAEAKQRPTIASAMKQRIENRLSLRLGAGFAYRQPESKWVDQSNNIRVRLADTAKNSNFDVVETTVHHPRHWNWSAKETTHVLVLRPSDDFTTVGGLLTTFRKADAHLPAIACTWYEQSRGFTLKAVSGWLCGDYHIEADSAEKALALTRTRDKRFAAERKMRADVAAKRDEAILQAAIVHRMFGFCMAGIRSFCELNGLDPNGSYTLAQVRDTVVRNRAINCGRFDTYLHKLGITLGC